MRDGKLKIEFTASEKFKSRWEPLGFACSLIAHSELHSKFPISYISKVINAAIKHRFIKFYFNSEGNAIGYVIWAYLAPDVEQKVMRTGHWNLHESEWNEGDSLWIVDLLAPYGDIGMILADLRDGVFASANEASYLRLKKDRAIGKQVARESCSYFFTRGQKKSRRLLSVPASNDVAVDVSNIIIKDTRTPLPPDWHISGAFMEIYVRRCDQCIKIRHRAVI